MVLTVISVVIDRHKLPYFHILHCFTKNIRYCMSSEVTNVWLMKNLWRHLIEKGWFCQNFLFVHMQVFGCQCVYKHLYTLQFLSHGEVSTVGPVVSAGFSARYSIHVFGESCSPHRWSTAGWSGKMTRSLTEVLKT